MKRSNCEQARCPSRSLLLQLAIKTAQQRCVTGQGFTIFQIVDRDDTCESQRTVSITFLDGKRVFSFSSVQFPLRQPTGFTGVLSPACNGVVSSTVTEQRQKSFGFFCNFSIEGSKKEEQNCCCLERNLSLSEDKRDAFSAVKMVLCEQKILLDPQRVTRLMSGSVSGSSS